MGVILPCYSFYCIPASHILSLTDRILSQPHQYRYSADNQSQELWSQAGKNKESKTRGHLQFGLGIDEWQSNRD